MISVGIRLPEDVFPQPDEPIGKLSINHNESPLMNLNGIDKNGKAHINRIVLSRTANVELLKVESPSRIWVRLQNHITESTLTFREPFELKKKTRFVEGDYVLAPSDERAFRRCRIIDTKQLENGLVKVFFIDDATVAYVAPDAIAELDEHYMFYPWQAIQISMFGIYPAITDVFEKRQMWTEEACDELRQILSAFAMFQVKIVLSSVVYNDYTRPITVTIQGIKGDEAPDKQHRSTVSIAELLLKSVPHAVLEVPGYDGAGHELYETRGDEADRTMMVLEYHHNFPVDWKMKSLTDEQASEEAERKMFSRDAEHPDFDPRQNRIKMLTIQELVEKFEFPDPINGRKHIMCAVEGKCTKSPYEWYARPIIKTWINPEEENSPDLPHMPSEREGWRDSDKTDWMVYGNDQLLSMAEQLDTYYSLQKNRRPLRSDEIKKMREEGHEVFAVCAVNEEKAMYTGEWQRVLILNCDDFAEVRFLDSGGRDMVLTSSLYRIHRQHCRSPPMCLQFSMHGVTTKINHMRADKKWNVKETANFKICLREDVPIFIETTHLTNLIPPQTEDPRPYMRKHVLMVKDVHYIDESKSVIERFAGSGPGCAELNPSQPQPWSDYFLL